ncbi:MAG: hypothetical protein JWP40_3985 [Blastococcus sp.]|nr:hypothetical protein [Blastococcus sp.]
MTAPAHAHHREETFMPKRRPRPPSRQARTLRHPADQATYQVDVMASVAAIISPDPRTDETTTLVLAAILLTLPKPADGHVLPAEFTGDARDLVATLRELHSKGWIGVENGRAYLTQPIHGAFGQLVDRVRVPESDRPDFVAPLRRHQA